MSLDAALRRLQAVRPRPRGRPRGHRALLRDEMIQASRAGRRRRSAGRGPRPGRCAGEVAPAHRDLAARALVGDRLGARPSSRARPGCRPGEQRGEQQHALVAGLPQAAQRRRVEAEAARVAPAEVQVLGRGQRLEVAAAAQMPRVAPRRWPAACSRPSACSAAGSAVQPGRGERPVEVTASLPTSSISTASARGARRPHHVGRSRAMPSGRNASPAHARRDARAYRCAARAVTRGHT